jgi:N-acyl-D-aspartate/D-glutamate deacylase
MRRAVLLLLLGAGVAPLSCGPRHEVAITNVRCLRGDGITDDACAVGIDGGRITYVGTRTPRADRRVDGQGGILSPGFVDTNVPGFVAPGAGSDVKLLDGVTTYLSAHGGLPGDAPALRGQTSVLNYATTVGVSGARERRAGADLLGALDEGLRAGAYGVSLSPEYDPALVTQEVVREVCERFGPRGVPIAFHTRFSALDRELDGVREAIACAESGAPVHLLHLASTGGTHHPREAIALVEDARRAGRTVLFDFYPYTSWASSIQRARFQGDWLARYAVGWDRVRVPGNSGALDAERFDALRRSGRHWVVMVDSIPEATVVHFARATDAPIGTDSAPSEGRLAHPRGAGSFMRFLHHYGGTPDSLGPALARFSTHVCERFAPWIPALAERGRVEVGYVADLVVLDPTTIRDHATSDAPLAPSTGVVAALVNGRVVVENRRPVDGVRDTGRWLRGRFTAAD